MKADAIPFSSQAKNRITDRPFRERGEGQYSLELLPIGITFFVTRLRRSHQETVGEVTVSVNGNFVAAKSVGGVLSRGNFNFSSIQTRGTLAKLLADRSKEPELDWHGFLDEFAFQVLDAERRGPAPIVLGDEPDDPSDHDDAWVVSGVPLLKEHPMVLFGEADSGKSYYAMYLAGSLAAQGVKVLYADWEFVKREHRKRLGRLFPIIPKNLLYLRCDKPMIEMAEYLAVLVSEHGFQYVICDSIAFAIQGRAEESEQAGLYFRAIRQLRIGSLHIAHTTKSDDDREKKIFGSVFFHNGARSVWFIQRADNSPKGQLQFGLFHRKNNVGERLKPKGFRFQFQTGRTVVESVKVDEVDELAAKLPLLDRMKRALGKGALSVKGLADATDSTSGVIRKMVSRHASLFVRIGDKVGLLTKEGASVDF